MKIIGNLKNVTMFKGIPNGGLFVYNDTLFMKVCDATDLRKNSAVNVESGCFYAFTNDDYVTPRDGELLLK